MERSPDYDVMRPHELKRRLDSGNPPVLLDVRERWEFELARIEGSRLVPLVDLGARVAELDPEAETVVICHHGARSAYVTQALQRAGFARVLNLEGGLDAYSGVDATVPRY